MSMCYWMIEGIGLCASSLEPHLSKEKVVRFLHKQLPNNEKIAELVRTGNFDGLDLEGLTCAWDRPYGTGSVSLRDILYSFFDGRIGDLLAHCDDTDTLTFCDDGDGDDNLIVNWNLGKFEVLVYANKDGVDYTNKFSVELRDDEEQLSLPPTNRYQDKKRW